MDLVDFLQSDAERKHAPRHVVATVHLCHASAFSGTTARMSQSLSAVASFLNLDVELESPADLAAIAEHLGRRVFVLFCGETDGGFRLSVEPVVDGGLSRDPLACTAHMLAEIEALQLVHADLWQSCSSRVFDFGFDGGLEQDAIHTNIPADYLARMAKLGIQLRITVYPYRANA